MIIRNLTGETLTVGDTIIPADGPVPSIKETDFGPMPVGGIAYSPEIEWDGEEPIPSKSDRWPSEFWIVKDRETAKVLALEYPEVNVVVFEGDNWWTPGKPSGA